MRIHSAPPESAFHPDLRLARVLPRRIISRRLLGMNRLLMRASSAFSRSDAVEIAVNADVSVRVHRPAGSGGGLPTMPHRSQHTTSRGHRGALLWIHGGGLVSGNARQDDRFCSRVAEDTGAVVASVEYRLAPEHPYPAPLEDCYAALQWLAHEPDVDPDRIAVGGASAGGGLAAALCLLARDRGELRPVFQLLVYPMLDDRTTRRTDIDERSLRLWDCSSNRFGWQSYLRGTDPDAIPPDAAPARCEDYADLPPAWIGVGTNDLFHDEDIAYAKRLQAAGVCCTLEIVPGAYHGFDVAEARAAVSLSFTQSQITALEQAFTLECS